MLSRTLTTLLLLGLAATAPAQDSEGELTKVKEQELEEVRERISELKQSMDAAAEERDRLTGELQEIDIAISEQRMRIADIERDQKYTANKKQKLDQELADREEHLDCSTSVTRRHWAGSWRTTDTSTITVPRILRPS
jgi:septal ring factor EnvC (AmiA/AmiB activator)